MLLALKTGAVGRQRAAVLTGLGGSPKDGGAGGRGALGGSGSRPPEKPEEVCWLLSLTQMLGSGPYRAGPV